MWSLRWYISKVALKYSVPDVTFPSLKYDYDRNITAVLRLQISSLWIKQKGDYPGWVLPDRGQASQDRVTQSHKKGPWSTVMCVDVDVLQMLSGVLKHLWPASKSESRTVVSDSLWMGYTVHGILQGRILEWVTFPCSRGPSQPRDQT